MILHIESATNVCAVSVAEKGILIHEKISDEDREHSRMLTVLIDELLAEAGYIYNQIDAVSVSRGPGSYTGLRIGTATAKGFCFSLDRPLIAIDTLYSMAWSMRDQLGSGVPENLLFVPMIDARRMEVYTSVYDKELQRLEPVSATILSPESLVKWKDRPLYIFGDGALKFESLADPSMKARFPADFRFTSQGLIAESYRKFLSGTFEDMAYFEPFYLKDFVGTGRT